MRKLLVKLVALETALVGWLGYWLFLVYSDNPTVLGGLASQLSKFPEISFTTVDITVLVVISVLSILLAFKFDRGLKPGIRLERALQMLESLMKRNLMLEAQVAEMKMANVQGTASEPTSSNEPPIGSWERAFRTPLEAGPTTSPQATRREVRSNTQEMRNDEPTSLRSRATRFDSKPSQTAPTPVPAKIRAHDVTGRRASPAEQTINERRDRPSPEQFATWQGPSESSSRTQPNPSPVVTPRRTNAAIAQPTSRRQPYIPIPATKAVSPNSLPGRGVSPTSRTRVEARSSQETGATSGLQPNERTDPQSPLLDKPSDAPEYLTSPSSEITRSTSIENYQNNSTLATRDGDDYAEPKTAGKSPSAKKRFPWEDE